MASNSSGFAFEREIANSGKLYGMHIYKIPTPRYMEGIYDFLAVWNGIPVAIECKATRNETSFSFDRVKPWQVEALQKMQENGGRSYILINTRRRRIQRAYILPITEYIRLRELYASEGRKSIPLEDLKELPQLNRLNPAGWDIRPLFSEAVMLYESTKDTTGDCTSSTSNASRSTKANNNKNPKNKDS